MGRICRRDRNSGRRKIITEKTLRNRNQRFYATRAMSRGSTSYVVSCDHNMRGLASGCTKRSASGTAMVEACNNGSRMSCVGSTWPSQCRLTLRPYQRLMGRDRDQVWLWDEERPAAVQSFRMPRPWLLKECIVDVCVYTHETDHSHWCFLNWVSGLYSEWNATSAAFRVKPVCSFYHTVLLRVSQELRSRRSLTC